MPPRPGTASTAQGALYGPGNGVGGVHRPRTSGSGSAAATVDSGATSAPSKTDRCTKACRAALLDIDLCTDMPSTSPVPLGSRQLYDIWQLVHAKMCNA